MQFLKEYGLLVVLVIASMVGYLLYNQHKEDILTYSLDTIGSRLVAMVDDPGQKASIAAFFDGYKERVLSNEVEPEQVASVAANVLNLSNSGARLTPEEAELVLGHSAPAPHAPPAATSGAPLEAAAPPAAKQPPPPKAPPSPEALERLGERLALVLEFDAQLQDAAHMNEGAGALPTPMRYRSDGGLHVVIDAGLPEALPPAARERMERELSKLDKYRLVVRKHHFADSLRVHHEKVRQELQAVVSLREQPPPDLPKLEAMALLASLKRLELQGFVPGFSADSLEGVLLEAVEAVEAAHLETATRAAQEALEAAARELEAAREEIEAAQARASQ